MFVSVGMWSISSHFSSRISFVHLQSPLSGYLGPNLAAPTWHSLHYVPVLSLPRSSLLSFFSWLDFNPHCTQCLNPYRYISNSHSIVTLLNTHWFSCIRWWTTSLRFVPLSSIDTFQSGRLPSQSIASALCPNTASRLSARLHKSNKSTDSYTDISMLSAMICSGYLARSPGRAPLWTS